VFEVSGVADGVADGMPLRFTQEVIQIDQRVIPKRAIFMVKDRTSTIDPAPSATASATHNNSLAVGKLKAKATHTRT